MAVRARGGPGGSMGVGGVVNEVHTGHGGGSEGIGPRRGSRVMRLDGQPLPTGRDGGGCTWSNVPYVFAILAPPWGPYWGKLRAKNGPTERLRGSKGHSYIHLTL